MNPVDAQTSTAYEHILAFRDEMAKRGIVFKGELEADGVLHRFHVEGQGNGSKNGFYLLHVDGKPNGFFGDWKQYGDEQIKWSAKGGAKRMSAEDRRALDVKIAEDKARRAAEQEAIYAAAAVRANGMWEAAGDASATHAYLKKKGIGAHGTRVGEWIVESPPDAETGEVRETKIGGALLVPLKRGKELVSLQAIFPDERNALRRGKDFLQEGRKSGCFYVIGGRPPDDSEWVITFCEGFATGASIHEATGRMVVVCFDCGNLDAVIAFFRQNYPNERFLIAADHDQWTEKPVRNPGVTKARAAAAAHNCLVAIPHFRKLDGKPTDFNDLHVLQGLDAVRQQIEVVIEENLSTAIAEEPAHEPADHDYGQVVALSPERKSSNQRLAGLFQALPAASLDGRTPMVIESVDLQLGIGSDVEIADVLARSMLAKLGHVVYTDGEFWRFDDTHWVPVDRNALDRLIQKVDGVQIMGTKGDGGIVKLGSQRLRSIKEQMSIMLTHTGFFDEVPAGINCVSGFIVFSHDGVPVLVPHLPEQRQRHVLPGRWDVDLPVDPPAGSLLAKLLNGVFMGDADAEQKLMTLAEVAGSAAVGYATKIKQPRAVILKGIKAENGKSQILDLYRALLPDSAVSAISPTDMSDPRCLVGLYGKLLNSRDELSGATSIAGNHFKNVVTGEPVTARDVYKPTVHFRPLAQNVFSTNALPPFNEGIDRGIRRRLLVISFNRTIPDAEKVEAIGLRIGTEEPDFLLAWAVGGASRLIRQRNFTIPQSSQHELNDWCLSANLVEAWADECVRTAAGRDVRTRDAHSAFRTWAIEEGYDPKRIPDINGFSQRAGSLDALNIRRLSTGRVFKDVILLPSGHPLQEAA